MDIKQLTPELKKDFFTFFDSAFSDHDEWSYCYCLEGLLERSISDSLKDKRIRREMAKDYIGRGVMQGYLAYEEDTVVGWCNANDKTNYRYIEGVKEYASEEGKTKSIWCFLVAAPYRGRGIAERLLQRVVQDAQAEGYGAVEAYPFTDEKFPCQYHGTVKMYERNGFTLYSKHERLSVMRKEL